MALVKLIALEVDLAHTCLFGSLGGFVFPISVMVETSFYYSQYFYFGSEV